MTLVANSSAENARYDADFAHPGEMRKAIDYEPEAIIVPTVILAELDYLPREFLEVDTDLGFLKAVGSDAFTLELFITTDLERYRELISGYHDLELGLIDAASGDDRDKKIVCLIY